MKKNYSKPIIFITSILLLICLIRIYTLDIRQKQLEKDIRDKEKLERGFIKKPIVR